MRASKYVVINIALLLGVFGVSAFIVSAQTTGTTTPNTLPAPQNLTQMQSPALATGISLYWNAVSGAERYRVERQSTPDSVWVSVGETTMYPFTDTTATPGVVYAYRVQACASNFGCSLYATLTGAYLPPSTTIVAPQLDVISMNPSNLAPVLSWNMVSGAGYYMIYRRLPGSTWASTPLAPSVTGTTFTDTSVTAGTSYEYYVVACTPNQLCSSPSNTREVLVGMTSNQDTIPPSSPTGFVKIKNEYNEVRFSWDAAQDNVGVSGYIINRATNGGWGEVGMSETTSFSDMTVVPSASYYYVVIAYDARGNRSATSTPLFFSTPAAPTQIATTTQTIALNAPTGLVATGAGTTIYLAWTDNATNESGYKLYRSIGGGAWTDIGNLPANTTTYANSGLPSGAYAYKVQAYASGASGTTPLYSGASNIATVTLGDTAITTPTPIPTPVATTSPIQTPTTQAQSVSATMTKGATTCEGTEGKTAVIFLVQPAGGAIIKIVYNKTAITEIASGTQFLKNGDYHWEIVARAGYTVTGITAGDFVLSVPCTSRVNATTTTTTATVPLPPVASPTQTETPLAPPPAPITPTTVESITTATQYGSYCDNPMHKKECTVYATEKLDPIVIVPITTGAPVPQSGGGSDSSIPLPGGVTDVTHLDDICAQTQYARECADYLVDTGVLSRNDADSRAEKLIAARAQVVETLEERAGARMFLDSDVDTITDYDELNIYHTDPKKKDTDGDGIFDGDELLGGTNPLISNSITTPSVPVPTSATTTPTPPLEATITYEDPRTAGDQKPQFFATTTLKAKPKATAGTSSVEITLGGKALPNSFVTLYIFSEPIVVTVKTDESGAWTYTLDKELPDGKHEVYSAITDTGGRILAKSEPLPFVKEAAAVSLGSSVLLPPQNEEPGFFSGAAVYGLMVFVVGIIGLALSIVGYVARGHGDRGAPPSVV